MQRGLRQAAAKANAREPAVRVSRGDVFVERTRTCRQNMHLDSLSTVVDHDACLAREPQNAAAALELKENDLAALQELRAHSLSPLIELPRRCRARPPRGRLMLYHGGVGKGRSGQMHSLTKHIVA